MYNYDYIRHRSRAQPATPSKPDLKLRIAVNEASLSRMPKQLVPAIEPKADATHE